MARLLFWLSFSLSLSLVASAKGASISPLSAGPQARSAYLNGENLNGENLNGENLNGSFDTLVFQVAPHFGAFLNAKSSLNSGDPRSAGRAITYQNCMLSADPLDPDFEGGLGLVMSAPTNTTQELSFIVTSLGGATRPPTYRSAFSGQLRRFDWGVCP